MNAHKYTDAQIEANVEDLAENIWANSTYAVDQVMAKAADIIRSLLAERKAAIQPQGGEVAASDWVKGDVYRGETSAYFTAGIDQKNSEQVSGGVWYNRIECYGVDEADAANLRDHLLEILNLDQPPVRSVSEADVIAVCEDLVDHLNTRPPLQNGGTDGNVRNAVPVAFSIRRVTDIRLNLSTVFNTEQEAQEWLEKCSGGGEVVPLFIHPQGQAEPPAEGHSIRVLSCDGELACEARWESGEGCYVTRVPVQATAEPVVKGEA